MRLCRLKLRYRSVEIQSDGGCLLNRLAIELGRFELIAHYSLERGILKDRLAADEFRIMRLAVFSHRYLDHCRAGNATGLGNRWVNQRASP